jgi:hypothetical protein
MDAVVEPEDRTTLGGGSTDVEGINRADQGAGFVREDDEGERRLAAVVLEQELLVGGGATP